MQLILLNKRGLDSGGGGLILLSAETPLVFSQWYDITDASWNYFIYWFVVWSLLVCLSLMESKPSVIRQWSELFETNKCYLINDTKSHIKQAGKSKWIFLTAVSNLTFLFAAYKISTTVERIWTVPPTKPFRLLNFLNVLIVHASSYSILGEWKFSTLTWPLETYFFLFFNHSVVDLHLGSLSWFVSLF